MPLDLSDDFDIFDYTETVTYQHRTFEGTTSSSDTTVTALRRAIRGGFNSAGLGTTLGEDFATWHVKADTLATPPKKGDRIVSADSGTWEVLSDHTQTWATRYALDTVKVT